jgi:hypothetical protein
MYSIYHFFADLVNKADQLKTSNPLALFHFDGSLLASKSDGVFPDLSIRLNQHGSLLSGGELIEIKDSKQSYGVASFNSTIPSGKKSISQLLRRETSGIRSQMIAVGDDPTSLDIRDVYYLVRGRRRDNVKVCLVHGSFFETVKAEQLVEQVFSQVLDEQLLDNADKFTPQQRTLLARLFSQQRTFSQVRNHEQASVKLRFRVMTEVKTEANILNSRKYPAIADNTLNLILPGHDETANEQYIRWVHEIVDAGRDENTQPIVVKHLLNGPFLVFQYPIP